MDKFDGEMSAAARQRARRQAKRKNENFRLRLKEQDAARRAAKNLRLASAAAAMSWAMVGIQLIR